MPNSDQERPPWALTTDDPDCDGFDTTREEYLGTFYYRPCAVTAQANDEEDAWPPDINDDRAAGVKDLTLFGDLLGKDAVGSARRYDLDGDGVIDKSDIEVVRPFIGHACIVSLAQPVSVDPTPVTITPTPTPTATAEETETLTASPTATPTPTETPPAGQSMTWADNNCKDGVSPVDSLIALRFDAGLSANTNKCPPMGANVDVLLASPHVWGDVDCKDGVTPVDALKILRFDAGLGVTQAEGCPEMGSNVMIVEG